MRLVMMGTGLFAEPTFEAILQSDHPVVGLITQPDRDQGPSQKRASTRQTGKGMKTIADEHDVPVFQPISINTPDAIAEAKKWNADLLVVAAYGQILSDEALELARLGGINVHASLLPKYRGAAPINWAIYHGESETGVTIIRMSTALDAGAMLAQEAMPIGPEDTAGEMEAKLAPLGASLAVSVIDRLESETAQGTKQDRSQVTKAPKMRKEHGLLHWDRTGAEICNHIRAVQPWPTPYTFLHREGQKPMRMIVYRARARKRTSEEASALPGQIVPQADQSALHVAVGGGDAVEILELQPAGKRRMASADFLRGRAPRLGDRVGAEAP